MSSIDIESLLQDVSPDVPEGENIEYDPAFVALELSAQGKPEQNLGDASVAGEPPDWKAVRKEATALLTKSKDLRIGVLLARALTNIDGYQGLSEGLTLTTGLLEKYWDSLHPKLDPEDDNDPTMRVNIIASLCDRDATLNGITLAPLVHVKGIGQFGLRDILVAKGDLPAPEDEDAQVPDIGVISAAFMDCPIEDLKTTAESLVKSQNAVKTIDALLMDKVGSAKAPDLSALSNLIEEAATIVNENLGKRGEAIEPGEESSGSSTPGEDPPKAGSGEIRSREDAARMMDKISDYFRKNEPSSPVPLLMQRAKRLSNLGFMEILKDIAPDGLKQAQNIGGVGGISDSSE